MWCIWGPREEMEKKLERKGYMDSMEMLRTKNDAFFIGGKYQGFRTKLTIDNPNKKKEFLNSIA